MWHRSRQHDTTSMFTPSLSILFPLLLSGVKKNLFLHNNFPDHIYEHGICQFRRFYYEKTQFHI